MRRRTNLVIGAALLTPIVLYAYAGRFSRLMADDFCYAASVRTMGFPAAVSYYYGNWFGRMTQIVGAMAGTTLGAPFAEIFPAVLLIAWLLGLLWLWREFGALLHVEKHVSGLIGASAILYATLAGTPQIFHSLYWISAVFPYTVPLVLATYFAALVLRALRVGRASPPAVLACIVLALTAGFSCEPFALAFAGAIAGGIFGVLVLRPRPEASRAALRLLIAAEITALFALVVMVAAPGNTVREGLFPPTHAPVTLVIQSLIYAGATIVSLIQIAPVPLPLTFILAAVIAYGQPTTAITRRNLRIWMALVAPAAFGSIVLATVPAIYATSTAPPTRVLIIPQFVLVCAGAVFGWAAGLYARKTVRRPPPLLVQITLAALLIAGPLLTSVQRIELMPKLTAYAGEWDSRETQITAAAAGGQETLVVAPLTIDVASMTGLDPIGADASAAINTCATSYYGLKSLKAAG